MNVFIMQIDYVKISCKEDVHICYTNFAKKMERNLHETTSWWKTYEKRLFSEDLEVQDGRPLIQSRARHEAQDVDGGGGLLHLADSTRGKAKLMYSSFESGFEDPNGTQYRNYINLTINVHDMVQDEHEMMHKLYY
jgi:hypothetical protein